MSVTFGTSELVAMVLRGPTIKGGPDSKNVQERLDRFLANSAWLFIFPWYQ